MFWLILVDIVGLFLYFFLYLFKYLTIGIRALSLAKEGKNIFLFLQICFLGKKKRSMHFRFIYENLYV
jgi:hypothetical protein